MTPPQEKFARLVAGGMDQTKAYREAYPKSRDWKGETAVQAASRLAANSKVSARVDQLRAAANSATALRIGEMRGILSDRIRALASDPDSATADLCRASDSLARISGWNTPDTLAAVAVQVITPEERARRIREALGIPEEGEGE